MLLNLSRAETYLEQYGLDAVVATSPVNVTYLTDYSCWLDPLLKEYMTKPGGSTEALTNYAIIARGGEGGLVIRPAFATNVTACWVSRLRFSAPLMFDRSQLVESTPCSQEARQRWELFTAHDPDESPEAGLASMLQEMGLADARIGVEQEGLSDRQREQLGVVLEKAEIRDCSNLLRLVRMVKSDEEQQRLARCAQINERAGLASLDSARAGVSIRELIRHYRVAIAQEDATLEHYAYSIDGLGIATQPDYTLQDGDTIFVDFGCIHDHQFSDTGTTLMVGTASPELVAHYTALGEALVAGQAAAEVGARVSSVHQAMASVIQGHRLSAPAHGHSLGLEVREYPILLPSHGGRIRDECVDVDADLSLEAGMIFNLETPLFLPPSGAFQIEKTFIMTDEGCRPLIEQNRSGPVVCT